MLYQPRKYIYITTQREGIHHYPSALTDPNLEDVQFLGYPHRHLFGIKVTMEVFGDDREVEFIQMKRWLESMFDKRTIEFNHKSCEMIADSILSSVWTNYCMIKPRHIIVEVNEDGENGAIVDNCYNLVSLNG